MDIQTLLYAPTSSGVRALREAFASCRFETQRPLVDAIPWCRSGEIAILGPAIGASAAVLACEPFLAAGCKQLVLFGICGGIVGEGTELEIGDTILPVEALREEGTSLLYGAPERFRLAPSSFQLKIEAQLKDKHRIHRAPVWTTDAPLRETKEKIAAYEHKGAQAVDMELSALAWLAAQYQAEFAACLVVSDLVGAETQRGFKSTGLRQGLEFSARGVAAVAIEGGGQTPLMGNIRGLPESFP